MKINLDLDRILRDAVPWDFTVTIAGKSYATRHPSLEQLALMQKVSAKNISEVLALVGSLFVEPPDFQWELPMMLAFFEGYMEYFKLHGQAKGRGDAVVGSAVKMVSEQWEQTASAEQGWDQMAFDAGNIKGKLDLDTTSFKRGFEEAHTHAETEGGHIREVLESLTEVINEALGPAFAQLGQQIQSVFAGFSEGPLIGSLGAVATAAGFVREAVMGSADEFHNLGLEAEKAGVSVEWLDRFSNVAGTANVGLSQIGMGLKTIEERAEQASQGNKTASESFERLGINSTRLAQLMKEPEALFDSVRESIGGMTNASERQSAAHDLMGRTGAALIPIMAMSKNEFDSFANTMDRLSGGVNDNSVKMSMSVFRLESYFRAGMEGIERAVSKPILAYLDAHMQQIEPKLEAMFTGLSAAIGKAGDFISAHMTTIIHALEGVAAAVGILAAASLPAILGGIGVAATAVAGPLIAMGTAIAAPVAAAIALGAGVAVLINRFPVLGQDAEALGNILKALGIVVGEGLVKAFDWLKEKISEVHVNTDELKAAWDRLANSPLAPVIHGITYAVQEAAKGFHWLQDEVSQLIDKLMDLAGMGGSDPNIPGAKNADDARAQLGLPPKADKPAEQSVPSPAGVGPTSVATVARAIGEKPAEQGHSSPSFAVEGPAATGSSASTALAASHAQNTSYADAMGKLIGAMKAMSPSGAPHNGHAFHNSDPNWGINALEGLERGRANEEGNIPTVNANGSLLLEPDALERIQKRALERQRGTASARNSRVPTEGADQGEDSIIQWRRSHPQQQDSIAEHSGGGGGIPQLAHSIDALTSRLLPAGSGVGGASNAAANPTTVVNNYTVQLSAHADQTKTASALAKVILPHLQKLQDQHQEKLAGQLMTQLASTSLGGN